MGVAHAEPMRDAATHEELVLALRKASQDDPMRKLAASQGKVKNPGTDPSVANRPKDIITQSDTLCFNGCVTLVPKKAILQIPANFAERLKYKPGAKLMNWPEFYALNRGWITTIEVSRNQAEGKEPLADKVRAQITQAGNLVIATYKGGPISLLPTAPPVTNTNHP